MADAEESRESVDQRVANMGFVERLKAAVKGTKEMRAILIRDPNKMISAAVLSSPKVTEQEAAGFCAHGEPVGGRSAGHRPQPRVVEELRRRARVDQESEDAARHFVEPHVAAAGR